MGWHEFIVAMTVAILGTTGIQGLLKWWDSRDRDDVDPEELDAAAKDAEIVKLTGRLDQFWEMVAELRTEVATLRSQVDRLRQERDEAHELFALARAETHIVHAHVLELRERLDDDPPWPDNYPHHLPRALA